MKEYSVYSQIKQLKEIGFKKANVAKQLKINRRTVSHYWDMTADDYEISAESICRTRILSEYKDRILLWIRTYPSISAAQVCDWLKENYSIEFSERTVARYVKDLRNEYHLKKTVNPRDYEAVPELPMGMQLQVDFGEKYIEKAGGGKIKVRFAAFVLAHSRQKYAQFQTRPFTASDLSGACHNCFRFYGGIPEELVFDQDSIVSVSENCGDIIYTVEFEKLRQECKFRVYLCRAADPESKGKIENVVKYIKGNFLQNRIYPSDDETLNYCCLQWLERTGNAKLHGTTKKIPAEVFKEEQEYLRPLPVIPENEDLSIPRTVRKDNTIVYDSNRYSVPLGTYNAQKEVLVEAKDGILIITTTFGDSICEHSIATGRGGLIKNTNHKRDRNTAIDVMQNELNILLLDQAQEFLQAIRKEKSRYARDQFQLLQSLCEKYEKVKVLKAISFCTDGHLYSVNYVKDYLQYNDQPRPEPVSLPIPVSDLKYHVTTEKRSLDVYAKAGGSK
ncbi:MAG: IS21 family transposase [Eubacteriales bacterium]